MITGELTELEEETTKLVAFIEQTLRPLVGRKIQEIPRQQQLFLILRNKLKTNAWLLIGLCERIKRHEEKYISLHEKFKTHAIVKKAQEKNPGKNIMLLIRHKQHTSKIQDGLAKEYAELTQEALLDQHLYFYLVRIQCDVIARFLSIQFPFWQSLPRSMNDLIKNKILVEKEPSFFQKLTAELTWFQSFKSTRDKLKATELNLKQRLGPNGPEFLLADGERLLYEHEFFEFTPEKIVQIETNIKCISSLYRFIMNNWAVNLDS